MPQNAQDTATFSAHAQAVIRHVQGTLSAVLERLPNRPTNPTELQRQLHIDKSLAWKVVRLIEATDPFGAVQHLPGAAGVRIFLDAAEDAGVPHDVTDAVTRAVAEFHDLTTIHAGDRASLDLMLSAQAGERRQQDLKHRKMTFLGNSYIWGVQAETQLRTVIMHPSETEGRLDAVGIAGFVGLRRIRPNIPWTFGEKGLTGPNAEVSQPARDPIEPPPDGADGAPLLAGFCSRPLPEIRRHSTPTGFIEDQLVGGDVGNTAAVTAFTAEIIRGALERYGEGEFNEGMHTTRVRTPCENLVFDLLFHQDLFGMVEPEVVVRGELAGAARFDDGALRLPIQTAARHLGRGPDVLRCKEIPRYAEMLRYVTDRAGWDAAALDVYRVSIPYPPMPSAVSLAFELPELT
jgi:hypothetical protein